MGLCVAPSVCFPTDETALNSPYQGTEGQSVPLVNMLGHVWFPDLVSILEEPPWELPVRPDVLSQARDAVWHPQPGMWKPWV